MPPNPVELVAPSSWTDDTDVPTESSTSSAPLLAVESSSTELALALALREAVGPRSFQLWFRDKTVLVMCDDQLIVRAVNPFLATLLQRQFREPISNVAARFLGPSARVTFEIDGSLTSKQTEAASESPPHRACSSGSPASAVLNVKSEPVPADAKISRAKAVEPLGPAQGRGAEVTGTHTIHNALRRFARLPDLIVGPCNRLATTAVQQVAAAPGQYVNPLYLFGGVGLGKTHLLEGLYCELRALFSTLNVLFLTAEQFANYFTQALRTHTLPSFRQRFRGVDVLLVDDVDFFDGKRGIQEEFLHTFKSLESLGKQIVVTADRHPRLLSQSSDELTTRLQAGLVCRLEAPDLETRTRIVQHKLTPRPLQLTPDAVALVAQWFPRNVRELEGALNCLEAHFLLNRQRLNASQARHILADLQRDCVRIVRLADVERAVCDLFRLIPDQLRSASRARHVAQPRMLAMYLARKLTQSAYSEIGEFFGGRNHSTVISAERQVQAWLSDETRFVIAAREWTAGELLQSLEQQLLAT